MARPSTYKQGAPPEDPPLCLYPLTAGRDPRPANCLPCPERQEQRRVLPVHDEERRLALPAIQRRPQVVAALHGAAVDLLDHVTLLETALRGDTRGVELGDQQALRAARHA